jgi:HEPN domain-containing protein
MGAECPTDTVCFHAQQCAEKYLKALLVLAAVDFPRTHDIGELAELISGKFRLTLSVEERQRLTAYATVTRYPGDYEKIPLSEARRAIAVARRVRREIRGFLPKEMLLRKRK